MQLTGRREPISMSGAWQGRAASYYASGLVLFAARFTAFLKSSRLRDLRSAGFAC